VVELEGRLVEIIFQNESNGYLVGVLDCEDEEVTIVGCLPALKEGEVVAVKGKWIVHPVYGRQMDVKEYRPVQPSTKEGILNYLASGVVKGIGKKMAERIIDQFGTDALEIIQYAPQRLTEVSGIGEAKAQTIAEAFEEQRELREIILFLSEYGITPNYAVRIYKKYKEMTIAYIQENPYRLADEIIGIGFKKADLIARAMGISLNSKYRIHSGIRYTINTFHTEGHTYAPSDILIDRARELLEVEEDEVVEGVQEMALKQKIQLERQDEDIIVYSMPYFYAETNACKKLIELSQVVLDTLEIDVDEEISNIEKEDEIALAENEMELKIKKLEAENQKLKAENLLLKKLDEIERRRS